MEEVKVVCKRCVMKLVGVHDVVVYHGGNMEKWMGWIKYIKLHRTRVVYVRETSVCM